MTTTLTREQQSIRSTQHLPSTVFTVLVGLAAVGVVLQGLWAGIFLEHDGHRDAASNWIEVHARGGEVTLVLVAAATVVAFGWIRQRVDLWLGGAVLTALLLVDAYVGGLIRDSGKATLTAVHVPLAMAVMGLAVWLTVRGRRAT
jgi:hypothetical protein